MPFLEQLGVRLPIIQAPMAGVSTPAMAAAVSSAGALGSLGVGAMTADGARRAIMEARRRGALPLHVNVFCHAPAVAHAQREAAWTTRLRTHFAEYGASPPTRLQEIYRSFLTDDDMLRALADCRPTVVSFHFGIPSAERIGVLRVAGVRLLASATSLAEARHAVEAGVHGVIAQGYEAGGHRGLFDPLAPDDRLATLALTRILVRSLDVPVIAAGGLMDGAGVSAALRLGAVAAQLGTAFVACAESAADNGYRAALMSEAAHHTVMTAAISGRPARCLANLFTRLSAQVTRQEIPDYPIAYDAGKALHAAAKARGEFGYGAQWAGQGAPLARALPAAELISTLARELR